jgi:anti-sigma B factor antagonist
VQTDLVLRSASCPDDVVRIQLAGVIDAHTLDRFEAGLAGALEGGARSLLLDCEELRYVNSAGFGELIRYFDRLKERGGTLVLARVPPKVAVILEMLGLKSLIPIVTSLEEGEGIAQQGIAPEEPATPEPAAPEARVIERAVVSASDRAVVSVDDRTVACAFCDTHVRVGGEGRWACPACGAPFTTTPEGGVAFDWSNADAEAVHITLEISPRTLAALAGLIEGILVERRVTHARMRRFAREAAHVCHLLAENAFANGSRGPLHVLALAGPQRLHLRVVDRGRRLGDEAARIFSTQSRLFLDFRYRSLAEGVNVTEFAFAYAGSGVFVS